ncbi:MAG: cell division protein FtsL [Acidobacteriota bacterium]
MSPYRYLVSKPVANERLVRQVDRKRHRELWMVAITGLVLAAAVLAYGWQHFERIQLGYRMEELRLEKERLVKIQRQLELERAALTSPDRLEAIAFQLGMVPPSVSQIFAVEAVQRNRPEKSYRGARLKGRRSSGGESEASPQPGRSK